MSQTDFQLLHHYDIDSWPEWGSHPRKPLVQFDMAHKGEWLDSVIGKHPVTGKDMVYHVLRCELCIASHIFPLPTEEELNIFYTREFYQTEKPDMIARYEADAEWWARCMHGPVLDAAYTAVRQTDMPSEQPWIVDIGAGPGLLLRQAHQRGWMTCAVEPSPMCTTRLLEAGHAVYANLDALTSDKPPGVFDIVTMWETLEHVSCPEDTLLRVWELLKPGGVVAICVPNDWNPLQRAACQQLDLPCYWISAPQHCWYFTPKTLQLLLRRAGFALCDIRGTFPIDTFLTQGCNYIGHDDIGRLVHTWRMQAELDTVERGRWSQREQEYRENLAQRRIGREIIAIGRKIP